MRPKPPIPLAALLTLAAALVIAGCGGGSESSRPAPDRPRPRRTQAFAVPTETPVLYPIAPLAASPNAAEARRFVAYILSAPAQAVLAKYGFGKP